MVFCINWDQEGNLIIEFDGIDFDALELIEHLEDNEISHIVSAIDGWTYLYDKNDDLVYYLDDYMFNRVRDLRDTGIAKLEPHKNNYEDYDGYEWNEGRDWNKS